MIGGGWEQAFLHPPLRAAGTTPKTLGRTHRGEARIVGGSCVPRLRDDNHQLKQNAGVFSIKRVLKSLML
jgi:hypothetical protein